MKNITRAVALCAVLPLLLAALFACGEARPPQDLYAAIDKGDLEQLRALIGGGASLDGRREGMTPLLFALTVRQPEAAMALLQLGADPNVACDGVTPLLAAVTVPEMHPLVHPLIRAGADPGQGLPADTGNIVNYVACSDTFSDEEIAAVLEGEIPSSQVNLFGGDGLTPLMCAASSGYERGAARLLELGADVNAVEFLHGVTPLVMAARAGRPRMVKLLLEHGADAAYLLPEVSWSPLESTVLAAIEEGKREGGHLEVVKLLLAHGVELTSRNNMTAFSIAAAAGLDTMAESILEAGYPIDSVEGGGKTPLMSLAQAGLGGPVLFLLEHGASRELKNSEGKTARDLALEAGHTEVAELLR